MSISKKAIYKIRRLAMHPSWVPSLDVAAHSVHIVLLVKRLCWVEWIPVSCGESSKRVQTGEPIFNVLRTFDRLEAASVKPFDFRFES